MRCPHPNCRKDFDRFLMFIDEFNKVSRETYYACPHCKSRVDIILTSEDAIKLSKGKENTPFQFRLPILFRISIFISHEASNPRNMLNMHTNHRIYDQKHLSPRIIWKKNKLFMHTIDTRISSNVDSFKWCFRVVNETLSAFNR